MITSLDTWLSTNAVDAAGTTWSVAERNTSTGQLTRSRQARTSTHMRIMELAAFSGVRA